MVKILLSNVGGTDNPGIVMMIKALVSHVDADFFVNNLTVCRDYQNFGIKYTWKPCGFDIALDLGGDTFTLYYGALQFLRHCFHVFLHVLFHQKFAIFAQTFSPYGKLTKRLVVFLMKRACFISVRDLKSYEQLQSMGIKSHLTADIAFLLDSWCSLPYVGDSYHRIIGAKLSGKPGIWDGSRADNFKFEIFYDELDLKIMKKRAEKNIELLQRALSG